MVPRLAVPAFACLFWSRLGPCLVGWTADRCFIADLGIARRINPAALDEFIDAAVGRPPFPPPCSRRPSWLVQRQNIWRFMRERLGVEEPESVWRPLFEKYNQTLAALR